MMMLTTTWREVTKLKYNEPFLRLSQVMLRSDTAFRTKIGTPVFLSKPAQTKMKFLIPQIWWAEEMVLSSVVDWLSVVNAFFSSPNVLLSLVWNVKLSSHTRSRSHTVASDVKDLGTKAKDPRCRGKWQKNKANNDHKIYEHSDFIITGE